MKRNTPVFLEYTICFIKRGDEILLLNRESPSWMGRWNGLGGKIENGESPLECVLREVYEEAEIQLEHAECKGIVSWTKSGGSKGGMYVFVAELPEAIHYETPKKTDEGIIDWKEISWIIHPENRGVAAQFFDGIFFEK